MRAGAPGVGPYHVEPFALPTVVFRNVAERRVRDEWNSKRIKSIRNALETNHKEAMSGVCVNCTESACPNHHRRGIKGILARMRSPKAA